MQSVGHREDVVNLVYYNLRIEIGIDLNIIRATRHVEEASMNIAFWAGLVEYVRMRLGSQGIAGTLLSMGWRSKMMRVYLV